jgi:DNA-directed RNA polymerase specialized sigma24 family protein
MGTADMATVLGISEGNVRVKLHRIKNQLREMWKIENYEPR